MDHIEFPSLVISCFAADIFSESLCGSPTSPETRQALREILQADIIVNSVKLMLREPARLQVKLLAKVGEVHQECAHFNWI